MWRFAAEVVWTGPASVRELSTNLEHRRRTILKLPADCHPRLSACLYPNALPRNRIDVTGDAALLLRIAALDELAELAELSQPMKSMGARLRLRSPAPHLVFNFPAVRKALAVAEPSPRDWQCGERRTRRLERVRS